MQVEVTNSGNRFKWLKLILIVLAMVHIHLLTFIFTYNYYSNENYFAQKETNFLKPYITYQLSLPSDLSKEVGDEIYNTLSKIEVGGVRRFEIITYVGKLNENRKDTSTTSGYLWKEVDKVDENRYFEHIVPISNLYTVNDDFNGNTQNIYISSKIASSLKNELKIKYPKAKEVEDIDKVLDENGKNVALISTNELDAKYKILKVNNKFFLDDINGSIMYALILQSDIENIEEIISKYSPEINKYSFNTSKVVTINQTGVTALTRALAQKIEDSNDYAYPAKNVASFLKNADLTHVSNEVSSAKGCLPADGLKFCQREEYIKTLQAIGTDIVELTGNHNNDFGHLNNLATINQYEKLGMSYFGGGKNLKDASKILYKEVKGSKIAFIGYNYYDSVRNTYALARENSAGANTYSESKMKKNIEEANKNADIVIVDFQFQECYSYPPNGGIYPICYKPLTSPNQTQLFRKAVDFGADIVVGTQAHQPQTYEKYKEGYIYYGLGNLFFDQLRWVGTRHGIILTHYIKEGKLLQTKLTTTNVGYDMRPYISKGNERTLLLNLLSEAR